MIHMLLCALVLSQPAEPSDVPPHVKQYLARCESVRTESIEFLQRQVKDLESKSPTSIDERRNLNNSRRWLADSRRGPAGNQPLPLPPKQDDMGNLNGVLVGPKGLVLKIAPIDVLEITDERNMIVRAWYEPRTRPPGTPDVTEDLTFIDLWIEKIDTKGLQPGPLDRREFAFRKIVFHVKGTKTFDTTCGSRAMPLLEPIDMTPYRRDAQQPTDESGKK